MSDTTSTEDLTTEQADSVTTDQSDQSEGSASQDHAGQATTAAEESAEESAEDSAEANDDGVSAAGDASDVAPTTDAAGATEVAQSVEGSGGAEREESPDDESDADSDADSDAESDAVSDATEATEKPKGNRVRQLEREGEVAADFLETLLDIADLDGDLDVDVDGDRAAVAIVDSDEGRVPRRLVGQDGKVLEALQELTRLAVQVETGERSRLMLDIAGHRAERRSTLVELAQTAIGEVKGSGEKKSLDPMSAFERKVVHDEVAAAGLVSESEGVDPKRHVVILPA